MTDPRFYLAVGLPIALNLTAITICFAALNKRIDDMRDVLRAEMKAESAILRTEMKADSTSLRAEMKADSTSLRAELKAETGGLRLDLVRMDAKLDAILNMVASHDQRISKLEDGK